MSLNKECITSIQGYVATTSVGASTVRSYKKGTVAACRNFLVEMNLGALGGLKSNVSFNVWLDNQTAALQASLPDQRRFNNYFGIARKVLNIYLHNCYYNRFLCERYRLDRVESCYEVPVDSHIAKGLHRQAKRFDLPIPDEIAAWSNIWTLRSDTHQQFQDLAEEVASKLATKRVHLDAYFYRKKEK